jgi:SAM-dependent methyltransferase
MFQNLFLYILRITEIVLKRLKAILRDFGINPGRIIKSIIALPRFGRDFLELKRQAKRSSSISFAFGSLYPCLHDRKTSSGTVGGHYFHQDLYVAQKVFDNSPKTHIDVGSRVDGLVAHIASFREITVVDIRPLALPAHPNIRFIQADVMELRDSLHEYTDSLSCLHVNEHFGLGRYGDPICYDGYVKGFNSIKRMLRSGGKIYYSVPIGPQRIEFNAHRIFAVRTLLDLFRDDFRLDSFAYVDDKGELHRDIVVNEQEISRNFGCTYGCGIVEATKKR